MLSKDGYKVAFRDQLKNRQMVQIIREVIDDAEVEKNDN